ncbi:Lar family restriction alleviation protein [Sphingomonas sp. S-NIH.Pt1_0416]|uniref:Lar family restriction alleviation protein n=1 Tax=Sphingomonas sp. S-NIH.Pt1_0416 TaxID=1920123 RepID=UPI0013E04839|nr:Lar family restriction alleviation protein [Sphingomonas sp. S-NIH.Pt1_0416]
MADQIPDSAKLLPCPFCGSDDVSMSFSATPQSSEPAHRFVECDMCGSCGAGVKIASGDDDGAKALAIDCWNTRAAPPAMDREAVERVREAAYRQALEDVCNPLGYLQRMADAEGAKLSGMAYAIASDIGTIQRIAKEALSTLSADAIRHGEGEASNRVIYLLQGDNSRMAAALRSCRDQFAFYAREHTVAGKSEKAATNARFAKIADDALTAIKPATPASHASDGGKA